MMKLYEFAPTRSIRVRWTLQELGVPFESVVVNGAKGENRQPWFLELNPAGKLPVLVDGDLVLNESVAIALYLADKYAEKGFLPKDARGRAEVYRWCLFAATELEQPLWRIARHKVLYAEAERIPAEIPIAARDFRAMAAVLDGHLAGREFVAGDGVTVADFVLAYTLDWADTEDLLGSFANATAYMERMYARPLAGLRIRQAFASVGMSLPDAD